MKKNQKMEYQYTSIPIEKLKPHPKNYRIHPPDEIKHIVESIKEHGLYRNVVVTLWENEFTILAGHGVIEASKLAGIQTVPVYQFNIDPMCSQAIKILIGDNEIGHLSEQNDRLLTDLLKEIKDTDVEGLLGTGFDEKMLANLLFITRPKSEINDFDEAAHWVGMPEYEAAENPLKLTVNFESEETRVEFFHILGITNYTEKTNSIWFPPKKQKEDPISVRFETAGDENE